MNKLALIRIFTFLGGIYFFLEFFLPEELMGIKFSAYHKEISLGFRLIGSMAIGLGVINILMIHSSKVFFIKKGWFNSFALLLGLFVMFGVTVSDWLILKDKLQPVEQFNMLSAFASKLDQEQDLTKISLLSEAISQSKIDLNFNSKTVNDPKILNVYKLYIEQGQQLDLVNSSALADLSKLLSSYAGTLHQLISYKHRGSFISYFNEYLYQGFFVSLGAAMFSLLAFYVASAAYRAFRVKSFESALMMLAAVIVMLGQIPFGIWIWDGFPELRLWLLSILNSAVFRAITIGGGIAGLIIALRMWLSIETKYTKDGI